MAFNQEHLKQALKRFADDEELTRSIVLPTVDDELVNRTRSIIGVPDSVELVTPSGDLTEAGRVVAETIVRPFGRPVLAIQDNRVTLTFLGPSNEVWRERLEAARTVLGSVIPAVGRVEVDNHPHYTWVGTGWLIAPQILVTNRHVAREFGQRGSSGFVFRAGLGGRTMQSTIDFLEEYERGSSHDFRVESILWIASVREPDVALLRLRSEPGRPLPRPIAIAQSVADKSRVATIGYPAADSRIPDQDLVKRIFGDVYEKKRLAPGEVTGSEGDDLLHDCTTLGGNSGSVLVDLATGEAVGLHYAGLYKQANYAVSAARLRAILTLWERGELVSVPDVSPVTTSTPAALPAQPAIPTTPVMPSVAVEDGTLRLQVPIEISVRIGMVTRSPTPVSTTPSALPPTLPSTPEQALAVAQASLANDPNVISVHLGYRFRRGWITDERVLAVTVREKRTPTELRAIGLAPLPEEISGLAVDVRVGALIEQLEGLGSVLEALERPPQEGRYRVPQHLSLDRLKERMKATFHVSPDAGFPTLRKFLNSVSRTMTATMYEWDAEHVTDAIVDAMKARTDRLMLVTQERGTREAIEDLKSRFQGKLQHTWAAVPDLFPSAYHIKVACRDDKALWLSSGNWKSSAQPDIDPIADGTQSIAPLRSKNREWHVVIENPTLATLFRKYIEWDFEEAQRELPERALPELPDVDVFVPDRAFAPELERPEVRWHPPLVVDDELDVQPLLTPDWRPDGERIFMAHALEMIAEAQERIYVQNQSFNLLQEGDNIEEFERFMLLLAERQRAGLDVRVIFRDPREFGNGAVKLQTMLERCKDFGLDTDKIRVQRGCHTKGLVVDGRQVMLGSHNLTNAGALFNRDASLRVRNSQVAAYFEQILLYDWDVLAKQNADELVGGARLAAPGEETPPGFRRVSLRSLLGEIEPG